MTETLLRPLNDKCWFCRKLAIFLRVFFTIPYRLILRCGGTAGDFKDSQFEKEIILWGIRWYVAYPISYRQLEEILREGVSPDFLLTPHRDKAAVAAFLRKAICSQGLPEKITIDQNGSNAEIVKLCGASDK